MLKNLIPPRSFTLHTQESIDEMKRRLIQEISPSQRGWNSRSTYTGFLKNNEFSIRPIEKSSRYREILEIKGFFQETEEGSVIIIKMMRNRSILFVYLVCLLCVIFSLLRFINEESSWKEFIFSSLYFSSFSYIFSWPLPEAIERQYRDITEIFGVYIDYPYQSWKQQLVIFIVITSSFLTVNFSSLSLSTIEPATCEENLSSSVYCNLSLSRRILYPLQLDSIAISNDGKILISAGDENIEKWNIAAGKREAAIQINSTGYNASRKIAIANNNLVAIASSDSSSLRIWYLDTNTQKSIITEHKDGVFNVTVSPDGKTLVSVGGLDGLVQVWNLDNRKLKYTINLPIEAINLGIIKINTKASYVTEALISSDNKTLFTINNGKVHLWELENGRSAGILPGKVSELAASLSISSDGKWLAVSGEKLWNLSTKTQHSSIGSIPEQVKSVAFSPDGKYVVGIYRKPRLENFLNVWNLQTGKLEISKSEISRSTNNSQLLVSPDGKTIVSASPIEIWQYGGVPAK